MSGKCHMRSTKEIKLSAAAINQLSVHLLIMNMLLSSEKASDQSYCSEGFLWFLYAVCYMIRPLQLLVKYYTQYINIFTWFDRCTIEWYLNWSRIPGMEQTQAVYYLPLEVFTLIVHRVLWKRNSRKSGKGVTWKPP